MPTLPKKGLKIAHVNICSLRNKVQDIDNLLTTDKIHILAISETHLDNTFDDATVEIQGYSIYRKDRDISFFMMLSRPRNRNAAPPSLRYNALNSN